MIKPVSGTRVEYVGDEKKQIKVDMVSDNG